MKDVEFTGATCTYSVIEIYISRWRKFRIERRWFILSSVTTSHFQHDWKMSSLFPGLSFHSNNPFPNAKDSFVMSSADAFAFPGTRAISLDGFFCQRA